MDEKKIITICKDLGCCDACCLRFIGLKNPSSFENAQKIVQKYLEPEKQLIEAEQPTNEVTQAPENGDIVPAKKCKRNNVCVSCIGILQDETWSECLTMVQKMMDEKRYESESFACALSAPVATYLREKAVALQIVEKITDYNYIAVTSLKEAWKWARGPELARCLAMRQDSGAVAPLLLTLELQYDHDSEEVERLVGVARGGRGEVGARRAVGDALQAATAGSLRDAGALPPVPVARARPTAAFGERRPLLLGGRYVKRSRVLPQSPWVLEGRRVLPSSVQELILAPLAALYSLSPEEAQRRLKFVSAGREDVDVRCLGSGRPFAVELLDPPRDPAPAELQRVCEEIGASGDVKVEKLVPVTRERLAELKRGEETKCKTYDALCIKLQHCKEDLADGVPADAPPCVTARDIARVSAWCGEGGAEITQRTPLRVLHRRPLLARARAILRLHAAAVPGQPRLLALRVQTAAGTYVKEWAHGELRRSRPALADALGAPLDILALDVVRVHLAWP